MGSLLQSTLSTMAHEHCKSCVQAHCTRGDECSVEVCPNGCGFTMHSCKLDEHDKYTCPEAHVPCTNAFYGCGELLPRRRLRNHLEHCPASSIMCSFSHDRIEVVRPIKESNLVNGTAMESDRELLIDEKLLQGDLAVWRKHRVGISDPHNGSERTSYTGTDAKEIYSVGEGDGEAEKALALSVECMPGTITNFSWKVAKGMRTRSQAFRERTCINVRSEMHLHYRGPAVKRYCCTFCCNEIVRRDEFAAHWKNLHLDIQIDMPVMVKRCPLHSYGCKHGELSLLPSPKGASLNYDLDSDATLLELPTTTCEEEIGGVSSSDYAAKIRQKQELALYGYEDENEESYDVLGQLPAEVLMEVCEHLDSLSLWYLSQVNRYLRSVCYNLVRKKGVVHSVWTRDDNSGCWTSGPRVSH